jgi:hypothetical protein
MEVHIRELEKHAKEKLAVIFVSIDEDEEAFKKFSPVRVRQRLMQRSPTESGGTSRIRSAG